MNLDSSSADPALASVAQSSFAASSSVIKSLLEDASTAALTTALSTLPYAMPDA